MAAGVVPSADKAKTRRPGCSNGAKRAKGRPQNEIVALCRIDHPKRDSAREKEEGAGKERNSSAGTWAANIAPTPSQNGSPEASTTTGRGHCATMVSIAPAIGLGQAIAIPISGLASAVNFAAGLVDLRLAGGLAAALTLGIVIGTPIAHALPQQKLRRLLGVAVVLAGCAMLLRTAARLL